MILVSCDKEGCVKVLGEDDNYLALKHKMDFITNELEENGFMLVSEKVSKSLAITYEFATKEEGWACSLILAHGFVGNVRKTDDEND
jgi:hypothetical protein